MIYNTTTKKMEFYNGTTWTALPGVTLGLGMESSDMRFLSSLYQKQQHHLLQMALVLMGLLMTQIHQVLLLVLIKIVKGDEDLLSQDYQRPETGENRYRFSNIYPVMKVTLGNMGVPSIDSMVAASKNLLIRWSKHPMIQ